MKHNRFFLLTALVLLCVVLSTSVLGANVASCTVDYGNEDGAFGNSHVRIYQIATMNEKYQSQICPDFAGYSLDFRKDMSNAYALSQTIGGYIALDDLEPYRTGTTDEAGLLTMEELPWGIYWISVEDDVIGRTRYSAEPSLLALPSNDGQGGHLFHIDLFQKITKTTKPVPNTSWKCLDVQKLWDDNGYESRRPEEIRVTLLQDGQVCQVVTLNRENNWKYSWTKLDESSKWQVVEDVVPDDYTVSVEATSTGYLITNTFRTPPPKEPPEKPKEDSPKDNPPGDSPDDSPPFDVPDEDVPTSSLPNTGLLTWPVPVLACSGLGSCLLGLILRRKKDEDDHD